MKTGKIFLCHASEDKQKVKTVYDKLKAEGFHPWLDECDLIPGQDFDVEIKKVIKSAKMMIVFFSTRSISKRGYIQRELKLGLRALEEIPTNNIFIIPVRLDDCNIPNNFSHLHYLNLFDSEDIEQILMAVYSAASLDRPTEMYRKLRAAPRKISTDAEVIQKCKEIGFFCRRMNKDGEGIQHNYNLEKGDKIVYDATTDRFWQKSGSQEPLYLEDAKKYIQILNRENYSGYTDWRFPTLEEALSLLQPTPRIRDLEDPEPTYSFLDSINLFEPEKNELKTYIDSVFDQTQKFIWTTDYDFDTEHWTWGVYFDKGNCGLWRTAYSHYYVRAVR